MSELEELRERVKFLEGELADRDLVIQRNAKAREEAIATVKEARRELREVGETAERYHEDAEAFDKAAQGHVRVAGCYLSIAGLLAVVGVLSLLGATCMGTP